MLDDQDTIRADAGVIFPAIGRAFQLIANIPAWHAERPVLRANRRSRVGGDFLQIGGSRVLAVTSDRDTALQMLESTSDLIANICC